MSPTSGTYLLRQRCYWTLVVLSILFIAPVCATQLQLSADNGHTWQPFDSPFLSPPESALVRLERDPSTFLHLPSCALKGSLRIQVWQPSRTDASLGLRWYSDVCHPHLTLPKGIIVEHINPLRRKPEWLTYARQREQSQTSDQSKPNEEKSLFAKYGLYVMLFIGVALGQGIRKGLAELREEMERDELEQKQNNSKQVKLVVPKRKQPGKSKRRAAAATSPP